MSSGFVTEQEISDLKQRRQEEWEKVRKADQPLEVPEEPYDSRSLYERLKEQKDKKDFEYDEAHKLKNLIRGLDDDEVDFLEVIDKAKIDAERKQQIEEKYEMQDFRQKVATLQEKNLDKKIQAEVSQAKITKTNSRPSQKSILSGMIRKRKVSENTENGEGNGTSDKKFEKNESESQAKVPKTSESQAKVPKTRGIVSTPTVQQTSIGALKCIGILPGIGGMHAESSDSEKSTDTEDDYDYSNYDWIGRKKINLQTGSNCGQ